MLEFDYDGCKHKINVGEFSGTYFEANPSASPETKEMIAKLKNTSVKF